MVVFRRDVLDNTLEIAAYVIIREETRISSREKSLGYQPPKYFLPSRDADEEISASPSAIERESLEGV